MPTEVIVADRWVAVLFAGHGAWMVLDVDGHVLERFSVPPGLLYDEGRHCGCCTAARPPFITSARPVRVVELPGETA